MFKKTKQNLDIKYPKGAILFSRPLLSLSTNHRHWVFFLTDGRSCPHLRRPLWFLIVLFLFKPQPWGAQQRAAGARQTQAAVSTLLKCSVVFERGLLGWLTQPNWLTRGRGGGVLPFSTVDEFHSSSFGLSVLVSELWNSRIAGDCRAVSCLCECQWPQSEMLLYPPSSWSPCISFIP